jgi:drebrin-like protein
VAAVAQARQAGSLAHAIDTEQQELVRQPSQVGSPVLSPQPVPASPLELAPDEEPPVDEEDDVLPPVPPDPPPPRPPRPVPPEPLDVVWMPVPVELFPPQPAA